MSSFTVLLTKEAADDIEEIYSYISDTLHEKNTADEYVKILRKSIKSLDQMPLRHKLLDSDPFRSFRLRRMPVKSFFIYYSVDEENSTVYIRGVIYSHRDPSIMNNR